MSCAQPNRLHHHSLTPNSCLIGILLITRSSVGPTLTFHYPLRPRLESSALTRSNSPTTSSSSESSGEDDDADEGSRTTTTAPPGGATGGGAGYAASDTESRSRYHSGRSRHGGDDEEKSGKVKKKHGEYNHVLGFESDFLAGLLAPRMAAAKGRFEMSVDDVVFLGAPVHVRPDGLWRKRKKRRRKSEPDNGEEEEEEEGEAKENVADWNVAAEGDEQGENGETGLNHHHDGDADDERDDDGDTLKGSGTMNMFHVVFVLNPPELEYHFRVKEMFEYVVKRFSRALKYEQAKDGYVWREAEKISRMKDQAAQKDTSFGELWRQILEQSNLAYAISRIYSDISQSKIAHVLLNNSLGLSLQIPIVSEIAVLPTLTDPQVPGLPLTTANSFGDDETEGDVLLAKHFTLLFLEDVESILKEIAAEASESSASLAHFVKSVKPTLSFIQISQQCGIQLQDIQTLARHLVHWRKARAIPPIHQRDTYIVSPNADMKRLSSLIPLYAKTFPTLPALPVMLSLLSGKPKPYVTFIPTRDHRGAYLEILTWLIRYSLVTQLRNFAWVKIPIHVKMAVHKERQMQMSPQPPEPIEDDVDEKLEEESFVLEPSRASGIESAWLEMCTRHQPKDVKILFERMAKYLNGQHALEKIAIREGISRREVRRVLVAMESVLVYAKHW
ncbi:nitrogen permease regulator of amino acid transport activity 3-domain-containing protein [Tricharina praecox]|uniref:nitrogen permease regulator of amino acid transport activity 3-domain-containing protein n=1 Tax=Tricharina praecox TaxID=43433 RepID=UPI00221FF556|nr:nitrogen permease regulator of amino acid transport activity 3-domain-containing protein [Tricharina praecox]KAI5855746.1 nitrogen permease regulator of amino acid transport activity 3-domain-containing protein [Tricharina praecox]